MYSKLTALLSALILNNFLPLINKQLLSALQCKIKENFQFALLQLILHYFSVEPKFPLISKVGPSPSTKIYTGNCQKEMMTYYQLQKLQNF